MYDLYQRARHVGTAVSPLEQAARRGVVGWDELVERRVPRSCWPGETGYTVRRIAFWREEFLVAGREGTEGAAVAG
jgi:hypothetical protein